MIKKSPTISKPVILLIIILLLSIFFRFYKIHDFLFWGMDQEYEAFLAKNILSGKHFPLIGVNASDTGLYLGPAFIYFASILFAFFSGNPLGWAITASVLGIITTYVVYVVGKSMFHQKTGLFASFLYGVSWLTSFYDRQFWNPVFVPLLSLVLGVITYGILQGKVKKLLLFSLILGMGIQSHLSLLIFVPIIIFALWEKRKLINKKIILLSIIIFIATQLPLIFFDLRHDFTNLKAAVNLLSSNHSNSVTNSSTIFSRNILYISSLGRFIVPPINSDWLVESGQCLELIGYRKDRLLAGSLILSLLTVLLFIKKNKIKKSLFQNKGYQLLGVIYIVTFIFIQMYHRQLFEYYLLYFFPWLAIGFGLIASYYWEKENFRKLIITLVIILAFVNIIALLTSRYNFSFSEKVKAMGFIQENLRERQFSLEAIGGCQRFGGYRYLVEYFIGKPTSSYMDSYFGWLYGEKKPGIINSSKVLLSLIDSRSLPNFTSRLEEDKINYLNNNKIKANNIYGNIKVYILNR